MAEQMVFSQTVGRISRGDAKPMKAMQGFTLIELMVAMAIFAIIMTAIYETYFYQQKSYLKQEQVVDMQQGMRAGMFFMKKDIRMAGYDPSGKAASMITVAKVGEFAFETDVNGNGAIGDTNRESIRYALTSDSNGDGLADNLRCNLGREYGGGGGLQPVTESVDALEFCYVLNNGRVTTAPSDPADVRAVIVSMLARTESRVKGYVDTKTYTPASQDLTLTPNWATDGSSSRPAAAWGPFNDPFQRKLLIAKLRCRNMGTDPFAD